MASSRHVLDDFAELERYRCSGKAPKIEGRSMTMFLSENVKQLLLPCPVTDTAVMWNIKQNHESRRK